MIKNLNKKKKGFTLIELIIVIAIIAILAAIAVPKFGEVRANAAFKTDVANGKTIANSVITYLTEENTYEITEDKANEILNNAMQNTPSPKSEGYTKFVVTATKGEVKVTMKGTDRETKLFPVPDNKLGGNATTPTPEGNK